MNEFIFSIPNKKHIIKCIINVLYCGQTILSLLGCCCCCCRFWFEFDNSFDSLFIFGCTCVACVACDADNIIVVGPINGVCGTFCFEIVIDSEGAAAIDGTLAEHWDWILHWDWMLRDFSNGGFFIDAENANPRRKIALQNK